MAQTTPSHATPSDRRAVDPAAGRRVRQTTKHCESLAERTMRRSLPSYFGGPCRNFTLPRRSVLVQVSPGAHNPRCRGRMPFPVRNVVGLKRQMTQQVSEEQDGLALLPLVEPTADSSDVVASNQRADGPRLSVVIPAMNEEGNILGLHQSIADVLDEMDITFELILVDDGSTDGTWQAIETLSARDRRVVGLRHRRNFGKARGLATGFAVASGELVLTMDADLQDDPTEIPRFLEKLDEGFDLVSGWKQRRQDPLGKTFPSRVFNATVRKVSGVPLHDFNCGFKLYRADVIQNIQLYGELHRFTPVLAHAEGFRIGELAVRHHARRWGTSKYGWSRLIKGFLDLLTVTFLTEYRQRPMHVLGLPGVVALASGGLIGLWLTAEKIFTGASIGNRPLLLLAVLLVLVGVQFFGLGLLGELLVRGEHAHENATRTAPVQQTVGLASTRGLESGLLAPARR
jgi:glycosyltransferase involved in cell wall biosynthesis